MPKRVVKLTDPFEWIKNRPSNSSRFIITTVPSFDELGAKDFENWQRRFNWLKKNLDRVAGKKGSVLYVDAGTDSISAAKAACLISKEMGASYILDPLCGSGLILAVANSVGLAAYGIVNSQQQYVEARRLIIEL